MAESEIYLYIDADDVNHAKFAEEVKSRCPSVEVVELSVFGPPLLCGKGFRDVSKYRNIREFLNTRFNLEPSL